MKTRTGRKRKLSEQRKEEREMHELKRRKQSVARDKVFGNELIMDEIMGYVLPIDPKSKLPNELEIRLINRGFNSAVIRKFRKEFRKISIGYPGPEDNVYPMDVILNKCCISVTSFPDFCRFLNTVVKVDFSSVNIGRTLRNVTLPDNFYHSNIMDVMLHGNYERLKVFTGMEKFCEKGCEKCQRLAVGCREYGPLQMNALVDTFSRQRHHFETLIVSEYLLEEIARRSAEVAADRRDCLERAEAMVTSNISCHRLVLKLFEKPSRVETVMALAFVTQLEMGGNIPTQPLPRELIEMMVKKWNVKCVKLEFHAEIDKNIVAECWSKFGYFTEIRFSQPYETTKRSNYRLELVEVDLENACHIMMETVDEIWKGIETDTPYDNLFANVRRMFPTNEMNVAFSRTNKMTLIPAKRTNIRIRNILSSVWKDNPTGLKMTIDMFSIGVVIFGLLKIPTHFRGRTLDSALAIDSIRLKDEGVWYGDKYKPRHVVGQRFTINDKVNRSSIDLGVFERDNYSERNKNRTYTHI